MRVSVFCPQSSFLFTPLSVTGSTLWPGTDATYYPSVLTLKWHSLWRHDGAIWLVTKKLSFFQVGVDTEIKEVKLKSGNSLKYDHLIIATGGRARTLTIPGTARIWILDYSGDLNNEHLKNGNIWITNIYLSGIQMFGIQMVVRYSDHHSNTGPVFKWCSEYRTKFSPVFKWNSSNWPFGDQTTYDHSNTRLVQYSDPHCSSVFRSPL